MTIYERISITQPTVLELLKQMFDIRRPRLRRVNGMKVRLWCGDDDFDFYEAVMQEKPKPGRGGLLSGEEERRWRHDSRQSSQHA